MSLRLREKQREPQGPQPSSLWVTQCHSHDAVSEVALEGLGLVSLHLAVLHGAAPERRVQLRHVHGRGALLVLGGVLANPVVQIHSRATGAPFGLQERGRTGPGEGTARFCVGKQSDHGISQFCLSPGQGREGRASGTPWELSLELSLLSRAIYGFIN